MLHVHLYLKDAGALYPGQGQGVRSHIKRNWDKAVRLGKEVYHTNKQGVHHRRIMLGMQRLKNLSDEDIDDAHEIGHLDFGYKHPRKNIFVSAEHAHEMFTGLADRKSRKIRRQKIDKENAGLKFRSMDSGERAAA